LKISPEHYFYLKDGQVIKDLEDLLFALETMSDDVFSHHVNAERNDFANWIKDVIKNKDLAREIVWLKDKASIIDMIKKSMKHEKEQEDLLLRKVLDKTNIIARIEEIISKEQEIELREAKIQEIEESIEKKIDSRKAGEIRFSVKAFVSGVLSGMLLGIIAALLFAFFFDVV